MPVVVKSNTPPSEKDEWRTPPALFNMLNDNFRFQLDAAADPVNTLCPLFFTATTNGLEQKWGVGGVRRVFCNPPFSLIGEFLAKGIQEYDSGGVETVFLIRADGYETAWFRQLTHSERSLAPGPYMHELRFQVRQLWPRVHYILPDGTKPKHGPLFPSALVIMHHGYRPGMFWYNWKKEAKERGYLK